MVTIWPGPFITIFNFISCLHLATLKFIQYCNLISLDISFKLAKKVVFFKRPPSLASAIGMSRNNLRFCYSFLCCFFFSNSWLLVRILDKCHRVLVFIFWEHNSLQSWTSANNLIIGRPLASVSASSDSPLIFQLIWLRVLVMFLAFVTWNSLYILFIYSMWFYWCYGQTVQ